MRRRAGSAVEEIAGVLCARKWHIVGMSNLTTWTNAVLSKPDLPAWLQAFAALVALFISVWAALRAGAVEKHRDRQEALGVAVAIYPEILKLEVTLENSRNCLRQTAALNGQLVGQSVMARIQGAQIPIPPMLDRNVDRLFMLGKRAGPSCLQLVNVLLQYNALVEEIAARTGMLNANQWAEGISQIEDRLALLRGVVAKCEHDVRPLHDAIKT